MQIREMLSGGLPWSAINYPVNPPGEPIQGRRQDFAKGGADARLEMPTPLRSGVSGPPGGLGAIRRP